MNVRDVTDPAAIKPTSVMRPRFLALQGQGLPLLRCFLLHALELIPFPKIPKSVACYQSHHLVLELLHDLPQRAYCFNKMMHHQLLRGCRQLPRTLVHTATGTLRWIVIHASFLLWWCSLGMVPARDFHLAHLLLSPPTWDYIVAPPSPAWISTSSYLLAPSLHLSNFVRSFEVHH